MANITKEQLQVIIIETIKKYKEYSYLKVIYDDKWKEDKKLAEKVNRSNTAKDDIVCIISDISNIVIFKKNSAWISGIEREFQYSSLSVAFPLYDRERGRDERHRIYIACDEENETFNYLIRPCVESIVTISILNEIIKVEKDLNDEHKLIDYYFELCKSGIGFLCCRYCVEQLKKYDMDNEEFHRIIGYVEYGKIAGVTRRAIKKAQSKTSLSRMAFRMLQGKKGVEKNESTYVDAYKEELYSCEESLLTSMKLNCIEGYYAYFLLTYMLLESRAKSSSPNSDLDVVNKIKKEANVLYGKLESKEDFYSGNNLYGNGSEMIEEIWFNLFHLIGDMYYNYIVDKELAMNWYVRALELNVSEDIKENPDIMYKIAMLYKAGDGGQVRSDKMMVYYLEKGANHNHALCELELAEFYRRDGDAVAAEEWKKRAKAHGVESDEDKQRRHQKHLDNVCTIAGVLAEGVATVVSVKKLMRNNEE